MKPSCNISLGGYGAYLSTRKHMSSKALINLLAMTPVFARITESSRAVRLPLPDTSVMGRVYHVHFDAIEPISVIPLLRRLALGHLLQIRILVFIIPKCVPFTSPHPDLHLAVCPVRSSIDEKNAASSFLGHNVAFPQVSVNQDRFDRAAV